MKEVSNKIVILVLIWIILAAFLTSYVTYHYSTQPNEGLIVPLQIVSENENVIAIDKELSNCLEVEDKNLEICKLELTECQTGDDDCFLKKAISKVNERMCYNISNEDKRAMCTASIKISLIKQRAVLEDNINTCDEFSELSAIEFCRDNYYIAKRYNEDNINFCNYIKNEDIKNECLKTN